MSRKELKTYKWKQKRLVVLERDGWECFVPGCPRRADTVDHITPPMYGGDDSLENLRAACKPHNSSKGNRQTPSPFFDGPPRPLPLSLLSLPETERATAVKRLKHLEY